MMNYRNKYQQNIRYGFIHKAGFTLVELLVVISIICILASLSMPMLTSATSAAHSISCQQLLRTFSLVNSMYSDNNHRWQWPVYTIVNGNRTWWTNNEEIMSYFGFDPSSVANSSSLTYWPKAYICPAAEYSLNNTRNNGSLCAINTSIGVNITRPSNSSGGEWYPPSTMDTRAFHLREIKSPQNSLQFVDATSVQVVRSRSDPLLYYYVTGETKSNSETAYRHNDSANVAFFDSHVRSVPDEELSLNNSMWYVNE